MMRNLVSTILLGSYLLACGGPEFLPRTTQAITDVDDPEFWARPMPSDLRREADGTWDLEKWPRSRESDLLLDWFSTANRRMRGGWGLSSGIFMPISGPLDAATLPGSPAASMTPESSVFLIDIDENSPEQGRRFPLNVEQLAADRYTPENLLSAVPVFGFVRRPDTKYALVLTSGVLDSSGEPLGRSLSFHQGFEGSGATDEVADHYKPLRDALKAEDYDLTRVVGAAVFTTFNHTGQLLDLVQWAEAQPAPELTQNWEPSTEYESYQLFIAKYEVPVIQRGERPYLGKGEGIILRDANGNPSVVGTQEVRIILSIPKQPMPAEGFPLTIYMHGSGGEAYQFADRGQLLEDVPRDQQPEPLPGTGPAEWMARRGVASLGFDFPLHGERHNPPDTSGLVLYNIFGNISATIDNFDVSAMELTQLSRLMLETEVALAGLTGVADGLPTGTVRFDPEGLSAMGQSMGTTIGVNWAGVDPRVKGLVFSGAGGILAEIAVSAVEPVQLKGVAELALRLEDDGDEVHINHPVLHAAQNIWDLVDPVAKATYVTKTPHPGHQPRHILMTAGVRDGYFHPRSQTAMAIALGVPLAGPVIEPILPAAETLAGRETLELPLRNNLNSRTAAVLQYSSQNIQGHYVVFNQEGARYQYTCFVAQMASGPSLLKPGTAADECR